jgi:hypothetical protein
VPPPAGDAVVAELVFERDVDRAREVALQVRRTPVRLVESPAHVEDGHGLAGVDEVGQLDDADQYQGGYGLNPRSCRASTQPLIQSVGFAGGDPPLISTWQALAAV